MATTLLAAERAIRNVDDFFAGVFAPLTEWRPVLEAQLEAETASGPITGQRLVELVSAGSHRILDTTERPLYGAGYCASSGIVSEGNPLAWWQGPERSLLASSTFGPGQAAIDLFRLEWYRVPETTGERHVAGPFVDYLCSNEITITSTLPIFVRGEFAGVVCADVLVADLEERLLPQTEEWAGAVLVNVNGRVVVSSDPDLATGDRIADLDALASDGRRLARSTEFPFAIAFPAGE
ncbi:PDC sensor domain-containing protein [Leucobacter edaphi]|uniref:PDC sensor domain-containing protein n=1 Tax=Leucobacter edaphi TaxID=2796472 RepID=UPI0034E2CB44